MLAKLTICGSRFKHSAPAGHPALHAIGSASSNAPDADGSGGEGVG